MRNIVVIAIAILCAIAITGCASSGEPEPAGAEAPGNMVSQKVSVAAGDVYEDCFELKAGQSMDYEFSADGELRYNLHWHNDADLVEYAVKKIGVVSDKGTFVSDKDEYSTRSASLCQWRLYLSSPSALNS